MQSSRCSSRTANSQMMRCIKVKRCRRLGRGNTVLQWAFSAFGAYRLADLPGSFCPPNRAAYPILNYFDFLPIGNT